MVAKSLVTVMMWMTYLAALFLFKNDLGGGIIALAVALMVPLLAINLSMWESSKDAQAAASAGDSSSNSMEKRKRDRLDAVLRELSDDQLEALKQRLSEPEFEDQVSYMLSDDGELIQREG